jgi:exodeoxyribonuclease V gamma subunit
MLSVTATDRLDRLVADLADRLGAAPLPPHRDECIVVQSLSLRRWLQQRLAERWGCAAGLDLPFPAGLIAGLEEDLGLATRDDPWHRDRLRWRIAALAEQATGGLAPLADYLAAGHPAARPAKRLQLADRLADLLDAYQIYRPEMLAAWEEGATWADLGGHPGEAWQAELWRRLRAGIPAEPRSRRLDDLAARLRSAGPPPGWHLRLSVLATGVLPPRVVDVLEALAGHIPVGIWLTSPLPQPWGDLSTPREARRQGGEAQGHPLVASLGRQARDWFREIGRRPAWADGWRWLEAPERPATGLLGRLQAAMGERAADMQPLDPADLSLRFDCCHGPRREVEVARDRILAACAELPELRPHEILVLAPDLTVYGPLVEAVFAGADPAIRLPVRISDRTIGGADAVSEGLLAILALAQGRCGLGEVLDLLELPAVRAAAGLRPDQVALAQDALARAGLRWGRDAGHRRELLGVEAVEDHGTLLAAVDRLMLGWAMGADAACGRPASGAEGAPDHELLGALLGWLQRLLTAVAGLASPRPLPAWCGQLHELRLRLLTADGLDAAAACTAIDALAGQAPGLPASFTITLAEVAAALHTELGGEARSSDFVSGCITVAGLKPMRMVPARVVVLLGMDDAGWPRRTTALPFDLLAAKPRIGDRQPREDDRQLFLEAILAAGERLVITWPGRAAQGDPRHERPPSACLAELFDAVDGLVAWAGDEADRPSRALTTVHPLQPFAAAYLAMGGSPAEPSWDAGAIALARQLAMPVPARPAEAVFADRQAPAPAVWSLDELVRLWQDPAAAWCRHRLGAVPQEVAAGIGDDEPFGLDALERYRLTDRLLASRDRQGTLDRAVADGLLPLGRLGGIASQELLADLAAIDAAMAAHSGGEPLRLELAGDAWRLDGVLDPAPAGNVLRLAHAGAKPNERGRLGLAIRLLAWNAWQVGQGATPGGGELVARDAREALPAHGSDADHRLAELMRLSAQALAGPLPFFPRTAWKLHAMRGKPVDEVLTAAMRSWQGDAGQRGECEQPSVALAWRGAEAITAASVELMQRVWELLIADPPAAPVPAAKPRRGRA